MTSEQESKLFQDIGSIKTGIDNLNETVSQHVDNDRTDFSTVHNRISGMKEDFQKLALKIAGGSAIGCVCIAIAVGMVVRTFSGH